jgi:hypothetical protein
VSPYVNSHGTYVGGSRATNPNNTQMDSYSSRGNVNPWVPKSINGQVRRLMAQPALKPSGALSSWASSQNDEPDPASSPTLDDPFSRVDLLCWVAACIFNHSARLIDVEQSACVTAHLSNKRSGSILDCFDRNTELAFSALVPWFVSRS